MRLRLFPGQYTPVQPWLGSLVMVILQALCIVVHLHRIAIVRHTAADLGRAGQRQSKDPASKDPRKLLDNMLIIGSNGIPATVLWVRAVLM